MRAAAALRHRPPPAEGGREGKGREGKGKERRRFRHGGAGLGGERRRGGAGKGRGGEGRGTGGWLFLCLPQEKPGAAGVESKVRGFPFGPSHPR